MAQIKHRARIERILYFAAEEDLWDLPALLTPRDIAQCSAPKKVWERSTDIGQPTPSEQTRVFKMSDNGKATVSLHISRWMISARLVVFCNARGLKGILKELNHSKLLPAYFGAAFLSAMQKRFGVVELLLSRIREA